MNKLKSFAATLILSLGLGLVPAVSAATLTLNPASGTINKGCNLAVKIDLDTQGADTDGTDAILLYDASRFTATAINNGTIYQDYPGNSIDNQAGKVVVSGLASVSQAFKGTGTLATVIFVVGDNAPAGLSSIKFDFDPNDKAKTTDSNVVERSTIADVLSSVTDGNFTIGSGKGCTLTTGTTGIVSGGQGGLDTSTPSASIPMKVLSPGGKTPGFTDSTFFMAGIGSVLVVLGIIGLALL